MYAQELLQIYGSGSVWQILPRVPTQKSSLFSCSKFNSPQSMPQHEDGTRIQLFHCPSHASPHTRLHKHGSPLKGNLCSEEPKQADTVKFALGSKCSPALLILRPPLFFHKCYSSQNLCTPNPFQVSAPYKTQLARSEGQKKVQLSNC